MRIDLEDRMKRYMQGRRCCQSIAILAPGCGLVACVYALVEMFRHLQTDSSTVGRALAGALTATLCGALCQNLFAGTAVENSGAGGNEARQSGEIILQGVLSLNPRPNPLLVETHLLSVVKQTRRAKAA